MPDGSHIESEWRTRKTRVDPKLDAAGWPLHGGAAPPRGPCRTEEHPTDNGPADYALWLDGHIVAVVEAKKLTVGPQNVLTQAERYARGVTGSPYDFRGFRVPFLYSTNGEVTWFHDVRNALSCSRRVAAFHTPAALREMLDRDDEAAAAIESPGPVRLVRRGRGRLQDGDRGPLQAGWHALDRPRGRRHHRPSLLQAQRSFRGLLGAPLNGRRQWPTGAG